MNHKPVPDVRVDRMVRRLVNGKPTGPYTGAHGVQVLRAYWAPDGALKVEVVIPRKP